jgi:hypothetical protein
VSQSPSLNAQSLRGAKSAHARKVRASQKRWRLAKMCFGVISVGALIAAVAIFAIVFKLPSSPNVENEASRAEPSSVATIVLHSGARGCQQRSFDNQTGQISALSSPCPDDVVFDAKGLPIPTGTVHTLNSISKSFK